VPSDPLAEGWFGLNVFGALARTVGDSALMLDVMARAGTPAAAASSVPGPYAQAAAAPPDHRLRVAVSRKLAPGMIAKISPDQLTAFDRTARLLSELGHHVSERTPAYGAASIEFIQTFLRGVYEDTLRLDESLPVERSTRQLAAIGRRLISPARRDGLIARRPATIARILSLWDEFDVLLTPGLARTALPAEGGYGKAGLVALDMAARFTPFTPVFNLTGQPAITIPAGFGADGLPTSVQLAGRHGAEALLYSLAGEIEAAQPWAPLTPPTG
jgi:amidase